MSSSINLEFYRKAAKKRLVQLHGTRPKARLADAQLIIAREAGHSSWRALVAAAGRTHQSSEDEATAFLKLIFGDERDAVLARVEQSPAIVNGVGRHPIWPPAKCQPLHFVIERGNQELFDLLLDRGADPYGVNNEYDQWSPLLLAIHWKRATMVEALQVRMEVNVVEALFLGDDALAMAALDVEGPHDPVPNGGTLLHFAKSVAVARRLTKAGVPVDVTDKYGNTSLDLAATAGLRDLVAFLVSQGAAASPRTWAQLGDVDSLRESLGSRPPTDELLLIAVKNGRHTAAKWLLEAGLSANGRDPTGSQGTLLHQAAWEGDLDMVQLLLAHGADWQSLDHEHMATPRKWAETAVKLFKRERCAVVADWLREQEI